MINKEFLVGVNPLRKCAFDLPAYWDRARVEKCRNDLIDIRATETLFEWDNRALSEAISLLYYVLHPEYISQDTSDGPVGMDEVDHD